MGRAAPHRPIRAAALAAFALAACAGPAAAGTTHMALGLNQSLRVALAGYAANVVVANPGIADVTMVDAHSAVIIGKAKGSSEVMVLDAAGRTLLDTMVIVTNAPGLDGQVTLFLGAAPHEYLCGARCTAENPKGDGPS